MLNQTLYFEQVQVGSQLPALVKRPTTAQLFRYSAVTWNAHRIHYEKEYAQFEGYPDVLVQSHLHGAFMSQMVLQWAGLFGRLDRFRFQNRRFALPGDILTCTGVVSRTYSENGRGFVECELEERNQEGELCSPGWALVSLPLHPSALAKEG